MKKLAAAGLVGLLGWCGAAHAIDRNADTIQSLSLNVANLDDADSIGGSIWGETVFTVPKQDWALLYGIGYDEISPDAADNIEAWTGGFGLKYYLTGVTSLGVVGTYSHYDQGSDADDKDAKAATAFLKQRLMPADEPVSPFAKGMLTWRDRSTFSSADPEVEEDSLSEVLLQLGGGIEFNMDFDFTFVLEAAYVVADASNNDSEDLDGFVGSLAMQYYFK